MEGHHRCFVSIHGVLGSGRAWDSEYRNACLVLVVNHQKQSTSRIDRVLWPRSSPLAFASGGVRTRGVQPRGLIDVVEAISLVQPHQVQPRCVRILLNQRGAPNAPKRTHNNLYMCALLRVVGAFAVSSSTRSPSPSRPEGSFHHHPPAPPPKLEHLWIHQPPLEDPR